ncbi:hypothetical protein [Paenibacillus lactis]|uniref:hypothetical protein n=1 Tax=Paenibacillus lactis TaxID=228574 RepID=UPI00048E75F6
MKKELRTFEIRLENNVVTISTDRTRIGTLEALIKTIFYEFHRKKPEELDMFMDRLNCLHEIIRNRGQPKEEVEPLDDFNFWKGLMEKVPLKHG